MNITNIIDVLIFLTIVLMGVIGWKKGVLKQTVSTVGFVLIVIVSFYLKNPIAEFLSLHFPFFKFGGVYGGIVSFNILLYQLIAFLIVILILETILQIVVKVTGIIEKILKFTIILGIPSKILGMIVGIIEGFIIVFIALFFFKQPLFNIKQFDDSKLTNKILNSTPILSNISQDFVDTFNDIYDLSEKYTNESMTSEELDLASIDTMLKHKIITTKYVQKLVDNGKIKLLGIDNIINKYE